MKTFFSLLFFSLSSLIFAQTAGSGNALHFSSSNQYVDIAQSWPIDSFPFTAMAWINPAPFTSSTSSPIINSHNSTSGYAGFLVHLVRIGSAYYLEGRLGSGGTGFASQNRKSKLVPFSRFNKWSHVAVVFNSLYNYDIYVNGILQNGSTSGSASSYNFNPSGLPRLGYSQSAFPTSQSFRGDIDEVSIWAVGLTQAQIRERMCKKIPVNSPGLVSYYKLDETAGVTANDVGPSAKNGTLTNANLRVTSGAPVGDEAAYFYPVSTNPTMKFVNNSGDTIKVANVTGAAQGIHIYTVNNSPNTQNGIVTNCPGNRYHGVFPVVSGSNSVNYQVQYRRSNYSPAVNYSRSDNSGTLWSQNTVTQTTNGFNWSATNSNEFITNTGPTANYSKVVSGALGVFTNTSSSGSPMTYQWDFGDGATSTAQNPQHFFSPAGTYWVCLTATDTCGSQTFCDSITTTCNGTALFGSQQVAARTVDFFNQSVGTGTLQYLWNFGDGTTSTLKNPSHVYPAEGTYYACLQTTDTCGTFTLCDTVDVSCFGLVSDFTFVKNNLTTSFTNLSTGVGAMSYYWTFGDGSFSYSKDPVYTYQSGGTYQVCLQTGDDCGSETKCYTLSVCLLPSPNFNANNTSGFTFDFLPTTTNGTSYVWNFGDGNFSTAVSPTYTYQNKGLYTVCLNIVDSCGDADTCIDVVASLVDLEENGNVASIMIYPNPARGNITVKGLPENSSGIYELTNALGQLVLQGELKENESIDVTSLPAGLYVLDLTNAAGWRYQTKLVVE